MALRLPLMMTVRRISSTATSIEIETVIDDADGTSVRSKPFVIGSQRSAAEVCSILQHDVTQLATALHARGEATIAPSSDAGGDLAALVGKTFTGSVST